MSGYTKYFLSLSLLRNCSLNVTRCKLSKPCGLEPVEPEGV